MIPISTPCKYYGIRQSVSIAECVHSMREVGPSPIANVNGIHPGHTLPEDKRAGLIKLILNSIKPMIKESHWLLDYQDNVYSQAGEDGVIRKILEVLPEKNKWCVEFGAWDGIHLSNARRLILEDNYSAVLIEGSRSKYEELCNNYSDYSNVIKINTFIGYSARDRLDVILSHTQLPLDFDFLSIDVDGNDYHIWRTFSKYKPKVVCIEYNPTIPTEVWFVQKADRSINQGASLSALVELGKKKNYELISVLDFNAFFIAREYYPLFNINDNSPYSLRKSVKYITYLFSGYDGKVFLRGHRMLPWHGIIIDQSQMQRLPAIFQKYPENYSRGEKALFRVYKLFVKIIRVLSRHIENLKHSLDNILKIKEGITEYYNCSDLVNEWGGPFNGENRRQSIVRNLLKDISPDLIIETGTYRGNTTTFLAKNYRGKIFTIESDHHYWGYSFARFLCKRNVHVRLGDSRKILNKILDRIDSNSVLFIYLDAHWGEDLPLLDEMDIIYTKCVNSFVMIDDFKIPDNETYGYDDYGQGKCISLEYLKSVIDKHRLFSYIPNYPALEESGQRRGWVLLVKNECSNEYLSKNRYLCLLE